MRVLAVAAAAAALVGAAETTRAASGASPTEVVVVLTAPPAGAAADRRASKARIAREQARFVKTLARRVPSASVRWRYRLVANGVAVVLPAAEVVRLHRLPGVAAVLPAGRYTQRRSAGPREIGAPSLWGRGFATAGQGVKIGIIDDGLDQTHPFFDPAGYAMPPGFPKGQRGYTTAKVIVARSFPPPGATWKHAARPFDPEYSEHGTHVAGIAAGNADTKGPNGQALSGVAPHAYLGNYKALTVPTDAGVGLDGNAPEIVAAIEAAVEDGMDVINLSIGEPEIEPTRDVVALALDGAAAAGVVPVVAAGNDYLPYGRGSVTSPGNSAEAITVASISNAGPTTVPEVSAFSSAGPTTLSLRLKPDVSAPGSGILSAVPRATWRTMSGTSMAAPHVAGAAALLVQQHPDWTPAHVKAALVATARNVLLLEGGEAPPTRAGSGAVDLAAATAPLVLATPTGVSFGLMRPDMLATRTVSLADAGGGAGTWSATVRLLTTAGGAAVTAPAEVSVPGTLPITLSTSGATAEEVSGFVRLERAGVTRRVPFWGRISTPALGSKTAVPLLRAGTYRGNTRGRLSLVDRYLYPELVSEGAAASSLLRGPEQVFRFTLRRPAENMGVAIVSRTGRARVEPRITAAGDENRLMGYAALPINLNPYLASFERPVAAAGVLSPLAGSYDIVFDSPTKAGAGAFTFRLWIGDVTPPQVRLVTRSVARGRPVLLRVSDAGSGVYGPSIVATLDGEERGVRLRDGLLHVSTAGVAAGRSALRVQVSDFQETRNNENVGRILPNTRVLRATITIRP